MQENLSKDPIKVHGELDDHEGELNPRSRINYSKIYTVENYVEVLKIGMVDRDSIPSLLRSSMVYRDASGDKPEKLAIKPKSTQGSDKDFIGREGELLK